MGAKLGGAIREQDKSSVKLGEMKFIRSKAKYTGAEITKLKLNKKWIVLLVGIAIRVRSTEVLRGHGGGITAPVTTMNYNTIETAVVVSSLPKLQILTWWQRNFSSRKLRRK